MNNLDLFLSSQYATPNPLFLIYIIDLFDSYEKENRTNTDT